MKFLWVSIFEKEKRNGWHPEAISGFPIHADLRESSIATQVDDVSSAFGDLAERFLRDLSPQFSIIFLNTKVG